MCLRERAKSKQVTALLDKTGDNQFLLKIAPQHIIISWGVKLQQKPLPQLIQLNMLIYRLFNIHEFFPGMILNILQYLEDYIAVYHPINSYMYKLRLTNWSVVSHSLRIQPFLLCNFDLSQTSSSHVLPWQKPHTQKPTKKNQLKSREGSCNTK